MIGSERIVKSIHNPDISPDKAGRIVFCVGDDVDAGDFAGEVKKGGYWEIGYRGNSRTIHTDRGPDAQLRYDIYKEAGFLG